MRFKFKACGLKILDNLGGIFEYYSINDLLRVVNFTSYAIRLNQSCVGLLHYYANNESPVNTNQLPGIFPAMQFFTTRFKEGTGRGAKDIIRHHQYNK